MKRVLIWGDNPLGTTGFGKVVRNVIEQIKDNGYQIDVLGISFWGDRPDRELGYTLYSAVSPGSQIDFLGHQKLYSLLTNGNYDVLFIVNDLPVVANAMQSILKVKSGLLKKFRIVHYFPVDGPVWEEEVLGSASIADYPVAYTNFGRDLVAKFDPKLSNCEVIYHGTDLELFKPLDDSLRDLERKAFWNVNADKFIVLNVNRNQPRKDLLKTFEVFAEFKKKVDKSYLFIMADPSDIGGDIIKMAQVFGLEWGVDWWSAPVGSMTKGPGFPEEKIVKLYQVSDVVISTSVGEGWGLSLTESMATKVPIVFPRHSSCEEIIGENEERGWLADCGGPDCSVSFGLNDRNVVRPRVRTASMVNKLMKVYDQQGMDKVVNASVWVPSWKDVGDQWRKIFKEASK